MKNYCGCKIFWIISAFFAVLLATAGCSASPGGDKSDSSSGGSQAFSKTNRIAVIGDSISAGMNPSVSGLYGWVHIMSANATSIWLDTFAEISNFAVSGSTASDWNNSLWVQPVINYNPNIVIVYIGANDILSHIGSMSESDIQTLSNNVIGILDQLTNGLSGVKLVMVDYYDLFDGYSRNVTNAFGVSHSVPQSYSNISYYAGRGNTAMSNIAVGRGYAFVDVYPAFMHHCYGLYFGDAAAHVSPDYVDTSVVDIHPSTSGHQEIFDKVKAVLSGL